MYCEEAFIGLREVSGGTALGLHSQISRCPASYASCQRDTARICCCAPCCSPVKLWRRPCSNWYLLPEGAAATATRRRRLQWVNGTDRRTESVPLHRPCSAHYAVCANSVCDARCEAATLLQRHERCVFSVVCLHHNASSLSRRTAVSFTRHTRRVHSTRV